MFDLHTRLALHDVIEKALASLTMLLLMHLSSERAEILAHMFGCLGAAVTCCGRPIGDDRVTLPLNCCHCAVSVRPLILEH